MTPALKTELEQVSGWVIPEHDILEWLLERLPAIRLETWHSGHVVMKWFPDGVASKLDKFKRRIVAEDDTAENAACKLAIALFQQNILTKEQV